MRKDTFTRLIHSALANPCLSFPIKHYACDALDLDSQPSKGLSSNVKLTFTLVEDTAAIPGTLMLQVKHAHIDDPYDLSLLGEQRLVEVYEELNSHKELYMNPRATTKRVREMLEFVNSNRGTADEVTRTKFQMAITDIAINMTLQSDVEGASSTVFSIEKLKWAAMVATLKPPHPAIWLAWVDVYHSRRPTLP